VKVVAVLGMAVSAGVLALSQIGFVWRSVGIGVLAVSAVIVLAWPSEPGVQTNVDSQSDRDQSAGAA
jgi:hypothetical protein